jgi:inosine-uridine nucleoside N-ribohydrolase
MRIGEHRTDNFARKLQLLLVRRRDALLEESSCRHMLTASSMVDRRTIMNSRASSPVLLAIAVVLLIGAPTAAQARYPIIYSTDLYYTIADIDDHFDAAVLLKSPELDIKGVILDNHLYPSDGEKVMSKLMEYTNRQVPVVKGLGQFQLRSLRDKGLYVDGQDGVELILRTLQESNEKVALMAVGSMTDLAAAYLRNPELLERKVSNVYVVAGSAEAPKQDYNVKLDPFAFVVIMRSRLPIMWIPVDSSMWYFPAPKELVPEKNMLSHFLLNELLYWYLRNDAKANAHIDRYEYFEKGCRLWSTPAFVHATHYPKAGGMFDVIPCKVQFDDRGVMKSIKLGVQGSNIRVVKNVNGDKLNEFVVSRINQ